MHKKGKTVSTVGLGTMAWSFIFIFCLG